MCFAKTNVGSSGQGTQACWTRHWKVCILAALKYRHWFPSLLSLIDLNITNRECVSLVSSEISPPTPYPHLMRAITNRFPCHCPAFDRLNWHGCALMSASNLLEFKTKMGLLFSLRRRAPRTREYIFSLTYSTCATCPFCNVWNTFKQFYFARF